MIQFGVVGKTHNRFKGGWNFGTEFGVLGRQCSRQAKLVSDGKIVLVSCGASKIQVVSKGGSHSTIAKMCQCWVE